MLLTLNGKRQKSAIVRRTLDPVWERQVFIWEGAVAELAKQKLELRVKDYDRVGRDDHLGVGAVHLRDRPPKHVGGSMIANDASNTHEVDVPLSTQGSVRLKFDWLVGDADGSDGNRIFGWQSGRYSDGDGDVGSFSEPSLSLSQPPARSWADRRHSVRVDAWGREAMGESRMWDRCFSWLDDAADRVAEWRAGASRGFWARHGDAINEWYDYLRDHFTGATAAVWVRSNRNRMVTLLIWDAYCFAICSVMFVAMVSAGVANEDETKLRSTLPQAEGEAELAMRARLGLLLGGLWTTLSGGAWDTWQAKITFQVRARARACVAWWWR